MQALLCCCFRLLFLDRLCKDLLFTLAQDIPCMDDAWDPAKQSKNNVETKVFAAASINEHGKGRKEKGQYC